MVKDAPETLEGEECLTALQCPYHELDDVVGLRETLLESGFTLASSVFDVSSPFIPGVTCLDTREKVRSLIWAFTGTVLEYF